ncbi:MAG: hypothetical protein Q8L48_10595 [Archangium sp.]|nr:hypothetical protein [Archangium sp.]
MRKVLLLAVADLSRPDVEYFGHGPGVRHQNLIRVRQEFNDKVMESAREL